MSTYYGPQIVPVSTTGLVTYLDAQNVKSYPGTGTSWFDLSGQGRTATLVNGPSYDSATKEFVINGNSFHYIGLSTGLDYNTYFGSRNYGVCLGYRITNYGVGGNNNGASYLLHGAGSGYYGGWRLLDGNTGTPGAAYPLIPASVTVDAGGSSGYGMTITDTEARLYNFVALSQTGSTVTMFLNGRTAQSSVFASYISGGGTDPQAKIGTANTINGGGQPWGCGRFIGRWSFLMLYNRAITVSEMQQNYAAFRGRLGI